MTNSDPAVLTQADFQSFQAEAHPFCLVCSRSNPLGLGLKFNCEADGSVSATYLGHPALEGFEGQLHGGVVASLLDGAMTNCLFARGRAAVAEELTVRYRQPVTVGEPIRLRAWIEQSTPQSHALAAELIQGDCVKVVASARFVERT